MFADVNARVGQAECHPRHIRDADGDDIKVRCAIRRTDPSPAFSEP